MTNKLLKVIKKNNEEFKYLIGELFRIRQMYEETKRLDWENKQRPLEEISDINRLSYNRAKNYERSINNKFQQTKSHITQSRIKELEALVEVVMENIKSDTNAKADVIQILLSTISQLKHR